MGRDLGGADQQQEELFPVLLKELEEAVATACRSRPTWPEQVGAGIYAGVDFAIDHPAVADAFALVSRERSVAQSQYQGIIERLAQLISRDAPSASRLPG